MLPLITIKNLMPYIPEDTGPAPAGAFFLKSDENADWYQAIVHFSPDTMKVMYDRHNIIVDANTDANKLWPYGLSVAEISLDALPEDFTRPERESMGKWLYLDGCIVPAPCYEITKAETEKARLISVAMKSVMTIQLKLQAGRKLTAEETAKLNTTLDYIDEVEATDTTSAPDIQWPPQIGA